MEKSFATHSHTNSIRSVTCNKNFLASGGADDSIYLYDLNNRVEFGRLMHHNGRYNHVHLLLAYHVKISSSVLVYLICSLYTCRYC